MCTQYQRAYEERPYLEIPPPPPPKPKQEKTPEPKRVIVIDL